MSKPSWWLLRLTGNSALAAGTPVAISEPPCKDCVFWRPVVDEWLDGRWFNGVICCHAVEQERDFSCFREEVADG